MSDNRALCKGLALTKGKAGVRFSVKVQPRSSRRAVEGVTDGVLRVRLTAPPAGGKANEQLLEVLSDALGIRKSAIKIVKGLSSRTKTVEVEGVEGLFS